MKWLRLYVLLPLSLLGGLIALLWCWFFPLVYGWPWWTGVLVGLSGVACLLVAYWATPRVS